MKNKIINFFMILFIAVNFILCTSSHNSLINIGDKDNQGTIRIMNGDTLKLVLKSNPSTGYKWEIATIDTSMLTMIDSQYISDKVRKNIVGSGGKVIKLFKTRNKGESVLRLIYRRSFEKEDTFAQEFNVTIIVQ